MLWIIFIWPTRSPTVSPSQGPTLSPTTKPLASVLTEFQVQRGTKCQLKTSTSHPNDSCANLPTFVKAFVQPARQCATMSLPLPSTQHVRQACANLLTFVKAFVQPARQCATMSLPLPSTQHVRQAGEVSHQGAATLATEHVAAKSEDEL